MATEQDLRNADYEAQKSKDYARQVRQKVIDQHYEDAYEQERRAKELD